MIKVTDNISFIKYDNQNISHINVLGSMLEDKEVKERTGPLIFNVLLGEEEAFLIEVSENIVGIIDFNVYGESCYIAYAILESERRKGYLSLLLKAVPNYVFNTYPNVKKVLAYIEENNIGSINGAINAGFKVVSNSNPDYIAYSYSNPNIINKNIR